MAQTPNRKPVPIERRDGRLFKASRQTSLRIVILLVFLALVAGAVLALGLKRALGADAPGGPGAQSEFPMPPERAVRVNRTAFQGSCGIHLANAKVMRIGA